MPDAIHLKPHSTASSLKDGVSIPLDRGDRESIFPTARDWRPPATGYDHCDPIFRSAILLTLTRCQLSLMWPCHLDPPGFHSLLAGEEPQHPLRVQFSGGADHHISPSGQ